MRILLSNDDGVSAPGIQVLAAALREFAEVQVVAPDRNRSGSSNALTLESPLRTQTLANGDIAVLQGTPTDCVYLGVNALMRPAPDIVVSGINAGPNLGDDVIYSGTVAAAMEGRIVQIGTQNGVVKELNLMPLLLKRLTHTGSTLRSRSVADKAQIAAELREKVWPLLERGVLKPQIFKTFPLEQAAAAHALMESSEHIGKIMLTF